MDERNRLQSADANIDAIASEFKRLLLAVAFPGMGDEDQVEIDPRDWKPTVSHGDVSWSFWDTGSGGKKTLFNVCYALALHSVALDRGLPVPTILIIDSPTKNISEDENPELVGGLYAEIYRIAAEDRKVPLQIILIDSEFVSPTSGDASVSRRRFAGTSEEPSLISYYSGP